ncbi:MAG: TIGR03088 family PEP-CTERM/XrtA system glycosyltransferase [Caldimonas sp.]
MSASPRPLVLHVIHHLVIGGMENGLVNLINHMPASRYGHAIACIEDFSSFRDRIKNPEVEVFALHRSRIGVWPLRRALYQLCRRLKPAIVHTRNLSGLDALLPARLAGVPSRVHGEHGWDMSDLHGTHRRPTLLRKLHSPLIDRYVAVSRNLETYLHERVGIRPERIRQIYNGVDTRRFEPRDRRSAMQLPESFRRGDAVVVGTVGRLQPVKDQATLVRAFAALAQRHPELADRARLLIVGDGPEKAELMRLAASLELGDRVHFTGPLEDVPAALSALDLFVLPSLNEGISNTILEAMASGLPVLASGVGGNVELIEEGVTGRLFQAGDGDALTAMIAGYLAEPRLRSLHGQAARARARDRFSLDSMVNQYAELYDTLH